MTKKLEHIKVVTLRDCSTSMFKRIVRGDDGKELYAIKFPPGIIRVITDPRELAVVEPAIERGILAEAEFTPESLTMFVDAMATPATRKRIAELEAELAAMRDPVGV